MTLYFVMQEESKRTHLSEDHLETANQELCLWTNSGNITSL